MDNEWKKNISYVWVVRDTTTGDVWIFYDGDEARKFAIKQCITASGHQIYYDTADIEDFKEGYQE